MSGTGKNKGTRKTKNPRHPSSLYAPVQNNFPSHCFSVLSLFPFSFSNLFWNMLQWISLGFSSNAHVHIQALPVLDKEKCLYVFSWQSVFMVFILSYTSHVENSPTSCFWNHFDFDFGVWFLPVVSIWYFIIILVDDSWLLVSLIIISSVYSQTVFLFL